MNNSRYPGGGAVYLLPGLFLFGNKKMDEHPGSGIGMATARQQQSPQHGNNSVNAHLAGAGGSAMGQHHQDEAPRPQQYTIPGILHYIQHEWARFEMERAHWEVERAELQVSNSSTELSHLLTSYLPSLTHCTGWVMFKWYTCSDFALFTF